MNKSARAILVLALLFVDSPSEGAAAQPFSPLNKEAIQQERSQPQPQPVQPPPPADKKARQQMQQQPAPAPALEARCRQYADKAVKESEFNRTNACGLTGSRWTSDYQKHFRWCLGASETDVNWEAAQRSVGLAPCSYCVDYAKRAVDSNERNRFHGCGFTGPRWTSNYQAHLDWCRSTPQWIVGPESEARWKELARCSACAVTEVWSEWNDKPELRKCFLCNKYAKEALAAHKENVEYSCNLSGPRWSADQGHHFRWCIGARQESVEQETRHRNVDARQCVNCTLYARRAVKAHQENLAKKCLFVGAEWSSDHGHHFRWCWQLGENSAAFEARSVEERKRSRALAQCQKMRDAPRGPASKVNPNAVQR